MIDEVKELLEVKISLEREYFELIHLSDEMDLSAVAHENLMLGSIAHSLAVIADALADRKVEPQTEKRTVQDIGDCEHCSRLFVDCDGR